LIRKCASQKSPTIKKYLNKLLIIGNKLKTLENEFQNSILVKKIILMIQKDTKHLLFSWKTQKIYVYIYFDGSDRTR